MYYCKFANFLRNLSAKWTIYIKGKGVNEMIYCMKGER